MKRPFAALACVVVFFPLLTLAASADIPAGFAPTSIFASQTNITAGDTISLFSVLYNSSSDTLTADVVFTIDGTSVGTKHVSLGAGETQTPSVSWTATTGSHTASAHLENIVSSTGEGASLLNASADTITLTVAPPPPPSATTQAIDTVTSAIASSTPVVTNVAQNVYDLTEAVRQGAINALQNQLGTSTAPKGAVLGASTFNAPQDAATSSDAASGSFLGSIWHSILGALLFICNMQILFYGCLLIVIFVLYKLLRTWMQER
jgi:hypothetical protein